MPKVFIVGGDMLIHQMYLKNSWQIVNHPDDADFLQFTGGEDVSPMLYDEPKHPATFCNPARDQKEANIFNTYEGHKKMIGICRGGQFLNVMNGGELWQDVTGHALSGTHDVIYKGKPYAVTSTHHQMMRPSFYNEILVTAPFPSTAQNGFGNREELEKGIEVVFYEHSGSLCFQPHPEYVDPDHECQQLFFEIIKEVF